MALKTQYYNSLAISLKKNISREESEILTHMQSGMDIKATSLLTGLHHKIKSKQYSCYVHTCGSNVLNCVALAAWSYCCDTTDGARCC